MKQERLSTTSGKLYHAIANQHLALSANRTGIKESPCCMVSEKARLRMK